MPTGDKLLAAALIFCSGALLPNSALGQAQIVDIAQQQRVEQAASTPAGDSFYQLQVLQEEVRQLRGLVEQLSYTINKVQLQQEGDYLDLDRRLAAVASNASEASEEVDSSTNQLRALTEVELAAVEADYSAATDLLLKQRDIDSAAEAYQQHIDRYPNSPYTANAWYWLGEIALLRGNRSGAEDAFSVILKNHSDHAKAIDAKFKLAKIYAESGDRELAKQLFTELAGGDDGTAIKARAYLRDNF